MKIRHWMLFNNLMVGIVPALIATIVYVMVYVSMWSDDISGRLTAIVTEISDDIIDSEERQRFYALSIAGIYMSQEDFDESSLTYEGLDDFVHSYDNMTYGGVTIDYNFFPNSIFEVFYKEQKIANHSFEYASYEISQTTEEQAKEIWDYFSDMTYHRFFTMSFPQTCSNLLVIRNTAILYNDIQNEEVGMVVCSFPLDSEFLSLLPASENNVIPFVLTTNGVVFSDETLNEMGLFSKLTNAISNSRGKNRFLEIEGMGKFFISVDNLHSKLEKSDDRMVQIPLADVGVLYESGILSQRKRQFIFYAFLLTLATIVLVFFTARFAARKITDPILRLKKNVADFQKETRPFDPPAEINNEIGELEEGFSEMSVEIYNKEYEIQRDFEEAAKVQNAILTAASEYHSLPGLEIDVIYRPMNELVSGDYYNIAPLRSGLGTFIVADITGHGTQAALCTMQLDVLFKQTSAISALDERMSAINSRLSTQFRSKNFYSAFLMSIYRGHMVYCSAGHPDQYLLRVREKEIVPLRTEGVVLGVVEEGGYQVKSMDVEIGDILILLTDGCFEQFSPSLNEFGEGRFVKFLQKELEKGLDAISTEELNSRFLKRLHEFQKDQSVNDDITLVTIRIVSFS